ncbi:tetratricopeptide repeat protein [Desulfothermobacter acidiphilus]|uniref:tetratricopeptide repeat protein n=1 Tax=Desulfothermobacter acidiphilus TaxID=1938353 RepID=UPI003F88F576
MFWSKIRGRGSKLILGFMALLLSAGLIVSTFSWVAPSKSPTPPPEANPRSEVVTSPGQSASWSEELQRAVAKKDLPQLLSLGVQARVEGRLPEAITAYQEVLKLYPDNTNARLSLAEIYLAEEKYDAAEQQVNAVLQRHPENPTALFYRGLILGYGKKDYPAAVKDLQRFLQLAPDTPEAWQARSLVEKWSQSSRG